MCYKSCILTLIVVGIPFSFFEIILFFFLKWCLFDHATNSIFVMIDDGLQILYNVLM